MRPATVCVLAVALAGCGGPDVGRATGGPLIDPEGRGDETDVQPTAQASGRPYAASPISETAEGLTELALAAVSGQPLPPSPVPTRRPLSEPAEVVWRDLAVGSAGSPTVLGIAFEIELVMKRGEPPPDAEGPERWGSIRVTLVLSRNGTRLVALRPRATSPDVEGGAPPPGLEGLAAVAHELLADLRRGDVTRYELTEADRALLANDAVWGQVQAQRLMNAPVPQIQAMLAELPAEPIAYRLDEVSVLARDADGRLVSFDMNFDPFDGSYALGLSPLIEVHRLWPR